MIKQKDKVYNTIRFCYSVFYVVLFSFYNLIHYKLLFKNDSDLIYWSVPAIGLTLVAVDFFTRRNLFKIPKVDILLLFFVTLFVSVLLNFQYGFMVNSKSMLWMGIQVFCLLALNTDIPSETHKKQLRYFTNIYLFVQLIGFVWSFIQYLIGYADIVTVFTNNALANKRVGFIEARLFGTFTDPNYACMAAIICMALVALNLKCYKNGILAKIYYAFSLLLQFFYVILSGSRMGKIIFLFLSFFVIAALSVSRIKTKKIALQLVSFVLIGCIGCGVTFGLFAGVQKSLAYLPPAISKTGIFSKISCEDNQDKQQSVPCTTETDPDSNQNEVPDQAVDLTREDVNMDNISNNRFAIWKDCLQLIRKTPLFGTGPKTHLAYAQKNFPDMFIVERQYSVHNGYLALFVCTGLIGGTIMMIWLGYVAFTLLSYLIRRFNSKDEYYWPIFWLVIIIAGQAISAVLLNALFFCNQSTDIIFWILMGYALLLIRKSEPERFSKPSLAGKLFDRIFSKIIKQKKAE